MVEYRWSIFWANLDPVVGSEQAGMRPVIVVSSETVNQRLPVVAVLPLTSLRSSGKVYPTEVFLAKEVTGLPKDSVVMAHQIRTIAKNRLGEQCGKVASAKLQVAIREALAKFIP
ncbi:type II toxin-antitoxin system PemK/MazF family toxin [Dethiobacter alkaliphilus]|uniref:mRNA interferase n=1 Tax=Dethiobacter alkaliphilus AHT 1 TaxID=555088 RepID=C0GG70_DETAL|nr:type II toxin-antitoxin system PemK/MazF family toxin [Dethiobacter alkaliphilus]EEG77759.1 transcriptional modulator of MazE/toxin, MazF [Dethiobacter alkaliphilus AHT 1]